MLLWGMLGGGDVIGWGVVRWGWGVVGNIGRWGGDIVWVVMWVGDGMGGVLMFEGWDVDVVGWECCVGWVGVRRLCSNPL